MLRGMRGQKENSAQNRLHRSHYITVFEVIWCLPRCCQVRSRRCNAIYSCFVLELGMHCWYHAPGWALGKPFKGKTYSLLLAWLLQDVSSAISSKDIYSYNETFYKNTSKMKELLSTQISWTAHKFLITLSTERVL